MKFFTSFFCGFLLFAETFDNVSFDWGGQFGYLKNNGFIFWNKDWRSNRLFFDGTWMLYPRMLGPEIESGFKKIDNEFENIDSTVSSYFQYDQGDYLLDRFSFGLKYRMKERNFHLHGFKRSYVGSFNQYNNETFQPLQQSYLVSYKSENGNNTGGFSLGHFNTFSGFPDTLETSIYDNHVTNTNFFWKYALGKLKTSISVDYFLQKFNIFHTTSDFLGNRFLTRSLYEGNVIWNLSEKNSISFLISSNNRDIKVNTFLEFYRMQWNFATLEYRFNRDSKVFYSFLKYDDSYLPNYGISVKRNIGMIETSFDYAIIHSPTHPYFLMNDELNQTLRRTVKSESILGSFKIDINNFIFLTKFAQLIDNDQYGFLFYPEESNRNNRMIDFSLERVIMRYINFVLRYRIQDSQTIYSGGFGKSLNAKIKSDISLFNNFMKLELSGEYIYYGDRNNSYFLNLLEMVPNYNSYNPNQIPKSINIINARIVAYVSDFMIGFEWYNINELILSSIGSSKNNYFSMQDQMPDIGRQLNLIIRWKFMD